ncbi:acyl-CoA ligase (AMP-forming), exosortase A system-associated [Thiospirillum jenense]|uniref:Acyl-CoA ligase (AMP-forming), exosortase A system-associated n=1 Tax=Thiospirillum jenense TaxID=1653858 RepID=A0A839HD98_9GAMM|nr:acyl-CoA ligase (AMP-forming), exosortase A system-associated [Thiospirillum jenense]MBB1125376.1 acyl-CoA ligase (AMP-forming), exosortase A system-associated [Thiospirillum jenense]
MATNVPPTLLHHLVLHQAENNPSACAVRYANETLTYDVLADAINAAANHYLALGLQRSERVAVYLEKRLETVVALFAAAAAGGVFIPINPLLKAEQVGYILADCNVRLLVTSPARLELLAPVLNQCPDMRIILLVGAAHVDYLELPKNVIIRAWNDKDGVQSCPAWRVIDQDMVAIFYTSGSTGRPKGVVLAHRNFVAGAISVAEYLRNHSADRILSVLPLSFDYGFNQLTTAFLVGASVVLMNYLLPRDVIRAAAREQITGLAAVPPLWIQLAQLKWPIEITEHLRYFTNSGGAMPISTLAQLRTQLPKTQPYLMYGLTEAFRSTYLPPEYIEQRPDSIGKAIPNAEIQVVHPNGHLCAPNEPGELVHRGVHVAMGYWNDPEKTAERFRPAPGQITGLPLTEIAVWSGDAVKMDDEGFLYFIGRRDEMIKTSGYRVSPTEIEEVIYATGLITEVVALGVAHPVLGQAIVAIVYALNADPTINTTLLTECQQRLPAFMVPHRLIIYSNPLPRNPNGKVDRQLLTQTIATLFSEPTV